jgi:hypothetical protein
MTRRPLKRATRRLAEAPPLRDPIAIKLRRRLKRGDAPALDELLGFAPTVAELMDALRAILMNEWVVPEDAQLFRRAAQGLAAVDPAAGAGVLVALRTTPGGADGCEAELDDAIVACGPVAHGVIADHLARFGDKAGELEQLVFPLAQLHSTHPDPRALPVIAAAIDRDWYIGAVAALVSGDGGLVAHAVHTVLQRPINDQTPEQELLKIINLAAIAQAGDAPPPPTLLLRAQVAEAVLGAREPDGPGSDDRFLA